MKRLAGASWQLFLAVSGDPLIQQFKTDEARAPSKVEELSKRYGARHPAMEAARTELVTAEASLRGRLNKWLRRLSVTTA